MNALADKVHKQGMPHRDMHSLTWPHYSATIPSSIFIDWSATATYIRRDGCGIPYLTVYFVFVSQCIH